MEYIDRLKLAIDSIAISNKDLSNELGVSPQYLSSIKNQNKLNETIIKFAELKNISLDWLVFGTGNMYLNHSNQNSFTINGSNGIGQMNGGSVNNTAHAASEEKQLKFLKLYQQIEQIAAWEKSGSDSFEKLEGILKKLQIELLQDE
jgi:DNA-binding Xre family transcriptional regulator